MKYETNDQIRTRIDELTERLRQIRIEKGLPPVPLPRPQIVEFPLTAAIARRLGPFKAIAIKLASIVAQDQLTGIDVNKLERYREYERLLYYSHGKWGAFYATGIRLVLSEINTINKAIEEDQTDYFDFNRAMRILHFALSTFLDNDYKIGWDMFDAYGGYTEGLRAAEAEMKRLIADDEAFQAAIHDAMAQLPMKEEDGSYE
ncbi:hypothetical protein JCM10914A_10930 [Paenibacillus sp. JCM 10914]|uniref:hypothetical protein n=1 Tax=Paenibacillus sp. JCM 10914 TaxID=1236974 RepID=UPI0003CC9812|nr:hypothetical protein [Paenibacillus sp. JCM 10914]GAE08160.1 hypothetical protein JCM10914_4427 [Paenibacillus sp. JCM 10914]